MTRGVCVLLSSLLAALATSTVASAQPIIRTVVGGGPPDGVPALSLDFGTAAGGAVDAAGNLYVADYFRHRVYRIGPDGHLSVVAGHTGNPGFDGDGGPATAATLNFPVAVAVDPNTGDLAIADAGNCRIRNVSHGIITTIAGSGACITSGDGGSALSAGLSPIDIAFDSTGNLFVADEVNQRVRRIGAGAITTVAGTGTSGFSGDGGPATNAMLFSPVGVALDVSGNLYIADGANGRIRRVSGGIITTIAGNGSLTTSGDAGPATLAGMTPRRVRIDGAGNLLIVDQSSYEIRRVAGGTITTIAGNGTLPVNGTGDGGQATAAGLADPIDAIADQTGDLFIFEWNSGRVRRVAGGIIDAFAGGGTGYLAEGDAATGVDTPIIAVTVDPIGTLYFSDGARIRKVFGGRVTTVAGTGSGGGGGDGGPPLSASFNAPNALAITAVGDMFIADTSNHRIRKISGGIVSTIAGTGTAGYNGEGQATTRNLNAPAGIAVGPDGTVYVADTGNNRIRSIVGTAIHTVAGNGMLGSSGDGGPATLAQLSGPTGVAVDAAGNIFVADRFNSRIRKISGGIITTVAGSTAGFAGDGGPATSASLRNPTDISLDGSGGFYVADASNQRVRYVNAAGIISTVAGNGIGGFTGDNGPATLASLQFPRSVAVSPSGGFFILDVSNWRIRQVITPQSSIIAWPTPADIVRGTPLGPVQLDATASFNGHPIGGTFAYSPPDGTILNAGSSQTLSVAFVPDDLAYESSTGSVLIDVLKATPTITWPTPAAIVEGTALGAIQLNAAASFGGNPVAGTFVYAPPAGTVLAAGAGQTLQATFTPLDLTNYNGASASTTIDVLPLPDLTVMALTPPAFGTTGAAISVTNTVANITTAAAASFRVGIYLSADAVCTTGDQLLGSRIVAGLAGGASSTDTTAVTVPATAATGAQFLCAIADDLLQVPEHLETNNAGSAPITIQAPAPTVTLKVNGQHPASGPVTTAGPLLLTLNIAPSTYKGALSWYLGLVINNQLVWVAAGGLSLTPAPLLLAPPIPLTDVPLLDVTLAPNTTITAVFALIDGAGALVSVDVLTAVRPPGS